MSPGKLYITFIGAGKSKFGIRLLNFVAKIFHINIRTCVTEIHPSKELIFEFTKIETESAYDKVFTFYCELITKTRPSATHPYEGLITQQLIDHFRDFRAIIPTKDLNQ